MSSEVVITGTKSLYSHAATISFWTFIEDSSQFGDNTFSVALEDRLKIWIGQKSTTKIAAWCLPTPNYYKNIPNLTGNDLQGISTKTQLEAQKADTEKNFLFKELDANKDKLWFNVRCAYTIDDKKMYLSLHNKDLSGVLKDGPKTLKLHNYINTEEIDFPFRDFNSANKVRIKTSVTTTGILMNNLQVFIDYLPDTTTFEYFK